MNAEQPMGRFTIPSEHLLGFVIWLQLLGYLRKMLADGSSTFKGKGTKQEYVFLAVDGGGNQNCKRLYREYAEHLAANE